MPGRLRTVRVVARDLGNRVVLTVDPGDQRVFDFGERVRLEGDEIGADPARFGTVSWDPVARWVVHPEEPAAPFGRR